MQEASDAVEDASNSRLFVIVARAGFSVSGVLHILIGSLAVRLAFGTFERADQGGAMSQLAAQPAGPVLLWTGFAACLALALWQLSEAMFSHGRLPKRKKAAKKFSAAAQGVVYAVIALTFASFAVGRGKSSGTSTSDWTVTILKAPLGASLLIAIGAAVTVVGVVFAVRGVRRSFTKSLKLPASPIWRTLITAFGVLGHVAKGFALVLVGLLFIIATAQSRPQESTGLDGALLALKGQPYGIYMLAILGAGLACYGIYMLAKGRFARM